ncbi:hypothetical protein GBA52_021209 [Prunus armeniaca]|nr:hypothetical protein GBA52_021209 [Prunus armeniaca]
MHVMLILKQVDRRPQPSSRILVLLELTVQFAWKMLWRGRNVGCLLVVSIRITSSALITG